MVDQDDQEPIRLVAHPWSLPSALCIMANFGCNMAKSVACFMDGLSSLCGQQALIALDQADAIASVHRDLEMLPEVGD